MSKKDRSLLEKAINTTAGTVFNDDMFNLPDESDFLAECFSADFFTSITKDASNISYFLETPFSTSNGYYPTEQVFLVRALPMIDKAIDKLYSSNNKKNLIAGAKEAMDLNKNDGDTIYFYTDTLQVGESAFKINNKEYESFIQYVNESGSKNGIFGIRFLGVNCPEIPHYSSVILGIDDINIHKKQIKDIKGYSNYIFMSYDTNGLLRDENTELSFWHNTENNCYYEIVGPSTVELNNLTDEEKQTLSDHNSTIYKIVYLNESDETINKGLEQKELIEDMLSKAEDILIMADYKSLNKQTNSWSTPYATDFFESSYNAGTQPWKYICETWNRFFSSERYKYIGYNGWGQDNNKRLLGAIYLKISLPELNGSTAWINLNKYLIYKNQNDLEILPDYSSDPRQNIANGFCSDAFKLWTYDINTQVNVNAFTSFTDSQDECIKNRNDVLEIVTGKSINDLKEYSVILGDSAFIVPPTSMRLVSQNQTQSVKLLRSRGSASKSMPKAEKMIEMTLYFNEEYQINGIPYEVTYPNKEIEGDTYYMNGLRGLIAQFRLTPFLPIENKVINDVWNIYAVTLVDLQVSTMPGFPKTLQARLTLQEFNYRIYMPELPLPDDIETIDDLNYNPFARCIHYPLMRYYYQRLLIKGNKLKDVEFNSNEYIEATMGQQTALIPMDFLDPSIEFYLPDKQWLDKRLQVAIEKEGTLTVNYELTDSMKECINDFSTAYDNLLNACYNKDSGLYKCASDTYYTYVDGIASKSYEKAKLYTELAKHVQNITGALNVSVINNSEEASLGTDTISNDMEFLIMLPQTIYTEAERAIFKKKMITRFGLTEEKDLFEFNKNGALCFKLKITFSYNLLEEGVEGKEANLTGLSLSSSDPGVKFLLYCKNATKVITDENGNVLYSVFEGDVMDNMQEELQAINSYNYLETEDSIQFVKYELGEGLNIESLNCIYSNSITRMTLNASEGYAHQYCGGQDTIIEIKYTTYNEEAVGLISSLPELAASYCIDYKQILNCWPLRIKSEITKLFGVNEVLIESVDTSTVPNFPGLYTITMRLTAIDRSVRNRETLKRLEGINNTGSIANENNYNMKSYFDLKQTLGKAEIYPDLELPTIDELSYLGYSFTQYYASKENTRKFVDPDFYFLYAYQTTHEIFRSALLKGFSDNNIGIDAVSSLVSDKFGAQVTIKHNSDDKETGVPFTATESNDLARTQKELTENTNINTNMISQEKVRQSIFSQMDEKTKTAAALTETLANLSTPMININEKFYMPIREKQYELTTNIDDEDDFYIEGIKSAETAFNNYYKAKMTKPIGIEVVELKDNPMTANSMFNPTLWRTIAEAEVKNTARKLVGDDAFFTLLYQANKTDFTESTIEYVAESFNTFTRSWNFGAYTVLKDIFNDSDAEEFVENTMHHFSNSLLAYADAKTGYSYCNETKTFIFLSTEDDKLSDENWKFKMFLNTETPTDIVSDFEELLIPYAKIEDKQDPQNTFASSLKEALEKGYSFGMYQTEMWDKDLILKLFVTDKDERAAINKSNQTKFFIDPYYRKLQLLDTDEAKAELRLYKLGLMTDPTFATLAFFRELIVWYKKLIDDNIAISFYELLKVEAKEVYEGYLEGYGNKKDTFTDMLFETEFELIRQDDESNIQKLEDKASKLLDDKINEYIKIYAMKYRQLYEGDDNAITDQGMEQNGVPECIREAIKKANSNKVNSTLAEYEEKLNNYSDEEQYEKATIEDFITILKLTDTSTLSTWGTNIAAIKLQLEENLALNFTCFSTIKDQILRQDSNMAIGKIMVLSLLNLQHGSTIYTYLSTKDTLSINSLIQQLPKATTDSIHSLYRKYLMALDGRDVLELETVGNSPESAEELMKMAASERVYIKRSNSIKDYCRDSWLDMILNDRRGRLIRAFPTYYMLFVDEGRKIGLWKLHDNFYNMNAISEISVTKSRKIAADTAEIVMSNMFKTFTTDDPQRDYDIAEINNIRYNMRDAFNSIFSPRTYYIKEEIQRQMQEVPRATQLQPGIRIHLRMGYTANAAELPIVFNGTLAEVGTGDVVQLVAQGDGIELMNPITSTDDTEDIQNEEEFIINRWASNWLTNGATPKEILVSILSSKGSWLHNQIKTISSGRFFNSNPYGLVHFGDAYYDTIFAGGEPAQNIWEANPTATFGDGFKFSTALEEKYKTTETPKLSMHVFGKTLWDIMHVCASAQPDYIASIAPFNMRSTVFYGKGRYYYAFDYEQTIGTNMDTLIREKRKPFQQQHIFTSYSDIIHNNISSSSKNIKTNAVGLYQSSTLFNSNKTKQVGPLYVDFDIYPEFQKSTTVDTQLWAKGLPIVGNMLGITEAIGGTDVGSALPNSKEIAWRMTASALKNSIKDMYNGEVTVIGYPSIKPYDRVWINDTYERMEGRFEVEAVVHNFNTSTGFTTSVYADCISVVDDAYEQQDVLATGWIVGSAVATLGSAVYAASLDKGGHALLKAIAGNTGKLVGKAGNIVKFFSEDVALKAGGLLTKVGMGSVDDFMKLVSSSALKANLIYSAVEMIVMECVGGYCSEWIYRYLQNLQVLQIYPLKRKSRVMVAGLDGHKGLVVGSPTENIQGDWTNFCISLFDGKSNLFSAERIINAMFGTEKIHSVANRLRRDADMPEVDKENAITSANLEYQIQSDIADVYVNKANADKRALMCMPRLEDIVSANTNYLTYYTLGYDFNNLANSYDITHKTYPIAYENSLQKYFNCNFINIFNNKTGTIEKVIPMNFSGQFYDVSYNEYYSAGNKIVNMPVLRFDAMVVLTDCIDLLAKRFKISDMKTVLDMPEVYITSATVLGSSKTSWENTGLAFRLQVASYDNKEMLLFAEEVKEFYKKTYNNETLLEVIQIEKSKEIAFIVKPVKSNIIEGAEF